MRATWSQGFEAVRNDADMNVFAAPNQEFWSIPVERLVQEAGAASY